MAKGKIAPITAATVGRHRILGRDRDGVNIEEKVCPLYSETFMDRDGNEMQMPLENGRIRSPEGARAGQIAREEGIQLLGWLPKVECPFTLRYFHLVKGPLVAPDEGEKDCGGSPEGCSHWHSIRTSRMGKARTAAVERNRTPDDAGAAALRDLGESISRWTETQMASAPTVKDSRKRMLDGKGEAA